MAYDDSMTGSPVKLLAAAGSCLPASLWGVRPCQAGGTSPLKRRFPTYAHMFESCVTEAAHILASLFSTVPSLAWCIQTLAGIAICLAYCAKSSGPASSPASEILHEIAHGACWNAITYKRHPLSTAGSHLKEGTAGGAVLANKWMGACAGCGTTIWIPSATLSMAWSPASWQMSPPPWMSLAQELCLSRATSSSHTVRHIPPPSLPSTNPDIIGHKCLDGLLADLGNATGRSKQALSSLCEVWQYVA